MRGGLEATVGAAGAPSSECSWGAEPSGVQYGQVSKYIQREDSGMSKDCISDGKDWRV